MKYKLLTLLALAFAIPAVPQTPPQPADVGQDLRNLERKWTSALVLGDAKALGEILDDTYLDADELGNQTDKNCMIDLVKSGDLKMSSIQLTGLKIHSFVYAAFVTGKSIQTGTLKGQKLATQVVFTDVFAMFNGVWKMVASQRTAIQSK